MKWHESVCMERCERDEAGEHNGLSSSSSKERESMGETGWSERVRNI
jgi:hypothetical protein